MKFLHESDSNSIYPNNDSALAEKDEYNNIINTLKYLKVGKKEMIYFFKTLGSIDVAKFFHILPPVKKKIC